MADVEPWLRGDLPDIPVLVRPLFFCFAQVREDLQRHVSSLTPEQLWHKPLGKASAGFHMRHLAGSVDRLLTYLEEKQLSEQQLQVLRQEAQGTTDFATAYAELDAVLRGAEQRLLALTITDLASPRYVGRNRLEATALGLLVHIAEHTQRHLGQAITTAQLAKAMAASTAAS